MGEVLTTEEIFARYPDQWVLVADPETTEYHKVLAGRVVAAGPDREQVYRAAFSLPVPRSIATLFTGQLPPDNVVVL